MEVAPRYKLPTLFMLSKLLYTALLKQKHVCLHIL